VDEKMKHKKVWIALLTIVVLVTAILIIYKNATRAVFKNITAMKIDMDESEEWNGGTTYLGVPYASDSESQYIDLYVPNTAVNGETPKLFVLVHGGGFITNDSRSRQAQLMYRYFRDQGYACASINYRLAQEEPFPGALCDVKAAIRFLRANAQQYGYDADRIAIWGESAGGYLAVAATVTSEDEFNDVKYINQDEIEAKTGENVSSKVDICVDYYGAVELSKKDDDWKALGIPLFIVDIANSWLHTDIIEGYSDVESFWFRQETETMNKEEASYGDIYNYINLNKEYIRDAKFWISHGDCDITVPILQSERLYDTLKGIVGADNVSLHIIEGSGHAGDIMYTDDELSGIKEYLDENL